MGNGERCSAPNPKKAPHDTRQHLKDARNAHPHTMGAFSHSAGTARAQRTNSANYYVAYPGNTPANHTPTESCMLKSKQPRGCRIQDPGTRGYWRWKTADFSHSARTAHGAPPMHEEHPHTHTHACAPMSTPKVGQQERIKVTTNEASSFPSALSSQVLRRHAAQMCGRGRVSVCRDGHMTWIAQRSMQQ